MTIDPGLFADVADALGIDSPAIVEKDVYAVQLLKQLSTLDSPHFELVFAGGTSLAKAHRSLFRMSEDIDLKLVEREAAVEGMSRTAMKAARKAVLADIEALISDSGVFQLESMTKRNEYRYVEYAVRYPRSQVSISALRPSLKLDITASALFEPAVPTPVSSLYADALRLAPEIEAFPVVSLHSTISEKLVALLRRTAQVDRDPSRKDDETLVRHVYDLHMVSASGYDRGALRLWLMLLYAGMQISLVASIPSFWKIRWLSCTMGWLVCVQTLFIGCAMNALLARWYITNPRHPGMRRCGQWWHCLSN